MASDRQPGDEDSGQGTLAWLAGTMGDPRAVETWWHFFSARNTVLQLREYVPVLIDALERSEAEPASSVADRSLAARALDEETRIRIREMVDADLLAVETQVASLPYDRAAIEALDEEDAFADPVGALMGLVDSEAMRRINWDLITSAATAPTAEQAYRLEYMRVSRRTSGLQPLLRSQYIVAASLIQPFVASLLLLVLRSEKDELTRAAERPTLDSEVFRLLRQHPSAWKEQLMRRFDMSVLDVAIDWPELGRLWLRRNLFAHRGGMVDARYKNVVADAPPIGAPLELSVDDVYAAFDFAGGARMGFQVAAADIVTPGFGHRFAEAHSEFAMEDLDNGRWWLAEGTARAAIAFGTTDAARVLARVNFWLARDGRLGPDAIRDEVTAWNTTGLDPIFELAKLILLREDDVALHVIDQLLASGDLTRTQVSIWPLFARLRSLGSITGSDVGQS